MRLLISPESLTLYGVVVKKGADMDKFLFLQLIALVTLTAASWGAQPNGINTPGVLCSKTDANFDKYDYPEQVARCKRNVGQAEKVDIAALYGHIPVADWPKYEFDHLIPLCAGGSDDIRNLWPEPIEQAHKKDILENEICLAMKAGTLKQVDAVAQVHAWFQQNP